MFLFYSNRRIVNTSLMMTMILVTRGFPCIMHGRQTADFCMCAIFYSQRQKISGMGYVTVVNAGFF